MNKKQLLYAAAIVVTAMGAGLVLAPKSVPIIHQLQAQAQKSTTYTIKYKQISSDPASRFVGTDLFLQGKRANGDVLYKNLAPHELVADGVRKTLSDNRRSIDYGAHRLWRGYDPDRKIKMTTGDGSPIEAEAYYTGNKCDVYKKTGKSGKILGFDVVEVQQYQGNLDVVVWMAPDLACAPLKKIVKKFSDDAGHEGEPDGATITEAFEASTEPPPDSEFEIPADAQEVNQSEWFKQALPELDAKYTADKKSREAGK